MSEIKERQAELDELWRELFGEVDKEIPQEQKLFASRPPGLWDGDVNRLPIKPETKYLIKNGVEKGKRSEAIMKVLNALVWSDLSDADIFTIFAQYPIGEKYREQRNPEKWLQPQIEKARCRVTERADMGSKTEGQWSTPDVDAKPEGELERPSSFVLQCLADGERGDGKLFNQIHSGRFIFDHAAGVWFKYHGHCWKEDIRDEALSAGVDAVIDQYANEAQRQAWAATTAERNGRKEEAKKHKSTYDELNKRIRALQQVQRRKNVLVMAAAGTGLVGDEWDRFPYLLAVSNGVIDLKTGGFRPGRPDDYIKTAAPAEWRGINAECPTWERSLNEIFDGDSELVGYMWRLLGYGLIGEAILHIVVILWGQGRNGKGTILETLKAILGELCFKAESELLLEQKYTKASGAPNSGVLALRGTRFAWASETDEGRRLNTSRLKEIVGGDTLNARAPYGRRHVNFKPSHLLFLLTNNRPMVPASDYAIWQRIHLVPFKSSFVENPEKSNERKADLRLSEKLLAETAGVLAWLVRGCLEWQRLGPNPPEAVKAATREYRQDEDLMGHFLNDQCVQRPNIEIKASSLYAAYRCWCEENGHRSVSGTRFGKDMKDRFDSYQDYKGVFYIGVGLAAET